MECSLLSSSVYGLLQARILEGVAISFSRGPSQPRDQTWVSCITGRFFIVWTTREAQSKFSGNEVPLLLFIRGSCNLAFSSEGQFCWAKYSWLVVYFFQYFGYIISFFLGLQGLCWGIHWSLYGNSLVWEIFFPCCCCFFFFLITLCGMQYLGSPAGLSLYPLQWMHGGLTTRLSGSPLLLLLKFSLYL